MPSRWVQPETCPEFSLGPSCEQTQPTMRQHQWGRLHVWELDTRPCCLPPKWPEHWLDSLPNTFTFYKIASRGPGSVISTPAPFDTQHVSHSACSYQKEWFHIIKRQCQALLEAWLPHIQKIRAGSPVGVLRQELSPCTKVSVNVVRNPNTAMSEISLFFFFWPPLLFPPCQGLELLNSIPGAVLTFICLSTAPWYRERDHFYSNT